MYQRILLAYDGTREGLVAVREGAILAKRFGAQVFLLAVLPETTGGRIAEGVAGGVVDQQMNSYRALLDRAASVAQQLGLKPTAKLVVGEPAPQIGLYAKEVGADLIVVGHKPQKRFQRWWAGATDAYISDYVACSVLIGRSVFTDEAFEHEIGQAGHV